MRQFFIAYNLFLVKRNFNFTKNVVYEEVSKPKLRL